MIIRTKGGDYNATSVSVLLDYLGIAQKSSGVQKVANDVVLIASVPFQMKNEKGESGKIAENNEETKEGVPWTFSTGDLDRCGERIDPLGWDFSHYVKNPVVQWAHCFHIPAIGRAENISVDEKGLHGSLIFNDKEYDAFGWSIGERIKNGVIRAGSVGFRVIEIEIPDKETAQDGTTLIFRKQELLEFSVCNVPANPFALAQKMRNEELEMRNEERKENDEHGDIAASFWGSLINNI